MGRPRRQEPRRAQLLAATQRVLERDGLVGLRVREIAAEAGVSPASVLYYFPDSFQLAVLTLGQIARESASERAAIAASIPHPYQRLVALVLQDVADPLPSIRRAFCEIPSKATDHPELAALLEFVLQDQIAVFQAAVEDGVLSGHLPADIDAHLAARALVALLRVTDVCRLAGLQTTLAAREHLLAQLDALVRPRPAPADHGGGQPYDRPREVATRPDRAEQLGSPRV